MGSTSAPGAGSGGCRGDEFSGVGYALASD
jgi:hypothetical protein